MAGPTGRSRPGQIPPSRDAGAAAATDLVPLRLLCLGNELVADDAFGIEIAHRIREQVPDEVDVVATSLSGFYLMDCLLRVRNLVVIDTVRTGSAAPGTIYILNEGDVAAAPGASPHYVGLFEVLALGRRLHLPVPEETVIVAVEAADLATVGGPMHPAVRSALPRVVELVQALIDPQSEESPPCA